MELSKFMARDKIVWKVPLEGVFECGIRVGLGSLRVFKSYSLRF